MGYGFIRPDAGGPEVFFHASGCIDPNPKVGSRVAYRNGWDQKKQRPIVKMVRYETFSSAAKAAFISEAERVSLLPAKSPPKQLAIMHAACSPAGFCLAPPRATPANTG